MNCWDLNGNGVADITDDEGNEDTNGDGVVDVNDCRAGLGDGDEDEDGVADDVDECPNTPSDEDADDEGCSENQIDAEATQPVPAASPMCGTLGIPTVGLIFLGLLGFRFVNTGRRRLN